MAKSLHSTSIPATPVKVSQAPAQDAAQEQARTGLLPPDAAPPGPHAAAPASPDDDAATASMVAPQSLLNANTTALANQASGDTSDNGLSSMAHVVELADSLSHIADQLHERILQEIRSYSGHAMPDGEKTAMRNLMDDEFLLRQRAQALYADAATLAIRGLDQPQSRLMALTTVAAEKIRRIGGIGEVTSLVGAVLSLAGAVATGQLSHVAKAVEKIQLHNAALDALTAPRTATT